MEQTLVETLLENLHLLHLLNSERAAIDQFRWLYSTVQHAKSKTLSLRTLFQDKRRFLVSTVTYGPLFFPSIYVPRASRLDNKSKRKNMGRNLQYGPRTQLARGMYLFDRICAIFSSLCLLIPKGAENLC